MKPLNITITFVDGSQWVISDQDQLTKIGLNFPKGLKWNQYKGKHALRNKYFVMLDELAKAAKPGYTKQDFHEALKPLLFKKLYDFEHYFEKGLPEYSTRNLNREGWVAIIDQLRTTANDIYGYVFKD